MKNKVIFLLAALALVGGCGKKQEEESKEIPVRVRAAMPEKRTFHHLLYVQGNVATKNYADVAARTPGALDELFADEGAVVKEGDPLFQVDRVELSNRVAIAWQDMNVSHAALTEANAAQAEAEASYAKVNRDYKRYKVLFEEERTVAPDVFERAALANTQAEAGLTRAKAAVALAEAQVRQTESSFRIAEKYLADSLVRAPFDGAVAVRYVKPGEYVSAGRPVVRVEDPHILEISAFVSEAYFGMVKQDETKGEVRVRKQSAGKSVVYYKSATVNAQSRTFEVKMDIEGSAILTGGMLSTVALELETREGIGVPSPAVSFRAGKPCVFVVRDGRAVQQEIKMGIVDGTWTELLDADTLAKEQIIVEGQAFLNDGTAVTLVEEKEKTP